MISFFLEVKTNSQRCNLLASLAVFIGYRKLPAVPGVPKSFSDEQKTRYGRIEVRPDNCTINHKEDIRKPNDNNSLAHTSWNCKYHIVFAPKYRRQIFYGENRAEIGKILRELCAWKKIKIIEVEVCPDHILRVASNNPFASVRPYKSVLRRC